MTPFVTGVVVASAIISVVGAVVALLRMPPTYVGAFVGFGLGTALTFMLFNHAGWLPEGPWYAVFPMLVLMLGGFFAGGEIGLSYEFK